MTKQKLNVILKFKLSYKTSLTKKKRTLEKDHPHHSHQRHGYNTTNSKYVLVIRPHKDVTFTLNPERNHWVHVSVQNPESCRNRLTRTLHSVRAHGEQHLTRLSELLLMCNTELYLLLVCRSVMGGAVAGAILFDIPFNM